MARLSDQTRAALSQAFESAPDEQLAPLLSVVRGLPGDKARDVETLLRKTDVDRRRRREAFSVLYPLFRARDDGMASTVFPRVVLRRLWGELSRREAAHLHLLDGTDEEHIGRRAMVRARLHRAAAALVRHEGDLVWPAVDGESEQEADERIVRRDLLARYIDLAQLAQSAVRDLNDWLVRRDEDSVIGLRLALRDASRLDPDGVGRLIDLLTTHLPDAAKVLQLTVLAAQINGGEASLPHSELAVHVERVLGALETRSGHVVDTLNGLSARGRATARRDGDAPPDLRALERDLAWTASAIEAVDLLLDPAADNPWSARVLTVRTGVIRAMEVRLKEVEAAVTKLIPVREIPLAGRMKRKAPRLDEPVDPVVVEEAMQMARLTALVRHTANRFGCEARRQTVLTTLTEALAEHGELVIEAVSGHEVEDLSLASARAETVAGALDQLEAHTEAKTLRRRMASAIPFNAFADAVSRSA